VKWFWAIFLIARQKVGISAVALKKLLDIGSYQTIWSMCHKIRKAMSDRDSKYKLAGIVEMDETYFGSSKPGKRGRGAEGKTIVEVCVENNGDRPGYASMKVIEEVTSDEIAKVADEKLEKGSTVKSDAFKSYNYLKTKGYKLDAQKASGKDASKVLKWAHTLISNVKSTIEGVFHGIGGKHLQRFLDESCYRFNRRYKEKEVFDRLLVVCTRTLTITYSELTG
jgi:transposase-like protein